MLTGVAEGVLVGQSAWCETNTVVVHGAAGVLVVDPGIHAAELAGLADDLAELGLTAVAGFSTHPHWDHLLWDPRLGAVPRYATARCAATVRDRLSGGIDTRRFGVPDDVPLDLLGQVTGLAADATQVPWDGPAVRVVEHRAHAPGHAALLVPDRGVLVAGDMLSDVLVPMLDLNGTTDPIGDYLAALELLEGVAGEVDVVVPGHGSVGDGDELRARIGQDRAYVQALRDGDAVSDPRIGPSAKDGWDWVAGVHERQLQSLAQRNE